MFILIEGLPPFVVGIRAKGRITKRDYKATLLPALEKASAAWKGINFIFIMETDFSNFSLGAWLYDIKVNAEFYLKWNKIAMVSDKDSLHLISKTFSVIAPSETKTFTLAELAEAKEWISEP